MIIDSRLKVFDVLAGCGSFTLAARRLGMSQSAVSQNIALLEKEAGGALFERGRGSVSLTPKGRVFHAYAKRILALYSDLDSAMDGKAVSGSTVLDLGDGRTAEIAVKEGKIEINLNSSNN